MHICVEAKTGHDDLNFPKKLKLDGEIESLRAMSGVLNVFKSKTPRSMVPDEGFFDLQQLQSAKTRS